MFTPERATWTVPNRLAAPVVAAADLAVAVRVVCRVLRVRDCRVRRVAVEAAVEAVRVDRAVLAEQTSVAAAASLRRKIPSRHPRVLESN